jgi:DNA-binding transcriptional regulator YhcF (GntR family)
LAQQSHSYQRSTPQIHREADKLLEELVDKLVQQGLTREEAREHLRHWV